MSKSLIETIAISHTLVIALSLNDVAPRDTVPVAVRLLEPTSMLPKPDVIEPLSNAPTVLLADEPTGNLDPATAADVFAYLKQIIYETNTAALIVTHNMKLAANMDEMLEIRNGTIVKVMG